MPKKEPQTFYPQNRQQWRDWLQANHDKEEAVWVIFYRKSTGKPTISWSESVDEALCFGWIDSIQKKLDEERSIQYFSRRKPNSTWSRINKYKVEQLIAARLMTPAGQRCIDIAKANGSWSILDEVDKLIIPPDLGLALGEHPQAKSFYEQLSRSDKKAILQRLVLAKTEATRFKQITEFIEAAEQGLKPKHLRPKA